MTTSPEILETVIFKKKWFNPLYFILNDVVKIPEVRFIIVYGGKSSAKTVSISQLIAKECVLNGKSTLAFRKEGASIKTTLKKSFDLAFQTTRLLNGIEPLEFMYRSHTGSEIVLKGLDKEYKSKGVEGYTYVDLDELDHFTHAEFKMINLSLRGKLGQKIFASFNPVDEKSWIKVDYLDKYEFVDTTYKLPCKDSFVKRSTCGKIILIKTTYEDNYWTVGSPCGTYGYRDENLINEYKELETSDPESYQVNVLGEWGVLKPGRPFFHNYSSKLYRDEDFVYEYNTPLFLQFDFNKNPCTMSVSLIDYKRKEWAWIDAMLANEKTFNGLTPLEALCTKFKMKYIDSGWVHPTYLTITGDASDNHGAADRKANDTFYTTIRRVLGVYKHQTKVRKANQAHSVSRQKCNKMLNDIPCRFYRGAKLLVNDLEIAYVDEKNTMNEAKKELGLHFADGFRYGADCMLNFDNWEETISYYKQNFK